MAMRLPRLSTHSIPALARIATFAGGCLIPFMLMACTMQQTQTGGFDSDAWKSQRGVAALDNRRGAMVASLEGVVREGMPRADVLAALGEPDTRDAGSGVDVYELGVSGVGVDEEYYEIRYQDDRVASHRWGRR